MGVRTRAQYKNVVYLCAGPGAATYSVGLQKRDYYLHVRVVSALHGYMGLGCGVCDDTGQVPFGSAVAY